MQDVSVLVVVARDLDTFTGVFANLLLVVNSVDLIHLWIKQYERESEIAFAVEFSFDLEKLTFQVQ